MQIKQNNDKSNNKPNPLLILYQYLANTRTTTIYSHYAGQPALASTPS